jgi:hypothetical protein
MHRSNMSMRSGIPQNPRKLPGYIPMGPPVLGRAVPRLAKLKAISNDPIAVIIQANMAVLGFDAAANDAAEVKIPEPIQLPTTIATAAVRPSSLFNSSFPWLMVSLFFPIDSFIIIAYPNILP